MAKKNGKVKSGRVNYSSRGKGATKVNSRVDTTIVSTGRRIGKNITKPKYDRIRQKQALANRMIKESHGWLKPDHVQYKELREKKATFYHKRGLKSKSKLSMKDLRYGDLKAYENMLDSIINNDYFDREKYEKMYAKNIKNIREGLLKDENAPIEKVNRVIDVLESQTAQDLVDVGLKYDILDIYNEFEENDMLGTNDALFMDMLDDFHRDNSYDSTTFDSMLVYADEYIRVYKDFIQAVNMGKFDASEWELYKSEYMFRG